MDENSDSQSFLVHQAEDIFIKTFEDNTCSDDTFFKDYAVSCGHGGDTIGRPGNVLDCEQLTSTHSLPSVEDIRTNISSYHSLTRTTKTRDSTKTKNSFYFGINYKSCIIIILLLITGAAIGLGISLFNGSGETLTSGDIATNSESPTSVPTSAPTDKDHRLRQTIAFLNNTLPFSSVLDNGDVSPQYNAARWLASYDTFPIEMPNIDDDIRTSSIAYDYFTRYALVAFYYELHGEAWTNDFNFLSPDHHCYWKKNIHVDIHGTDSVLPNNNNFGVICDSASLKIIGFKSFSNNMRGKLPNELSLLTTLREINSQNDFIRGEIPNSYKLLTNLEVFGLYRNEIEGTIPEWLGNLKYLIEFDLSNNILSGAIPSEIGQCTNLVTLDVSRNRLDSSIPEELKNLSELKSLILHNNELTGTFPEWISIERLPKLEDFRLSNNDFSGSIPDALATMSETLTYLYLDGNSFDGSIEVFSYLTNLQILILSDNNFSQDIDKIFSSLNNLVIFDASDNYLTGSISKEIFQLDYLKVLDLSYNNIDGNFPDNTEANLSNSSLGYISLSNNQMSNPIPPSISKLHALTHLDLSDNNFNKDIPTEIGLLKELLYLSISHNDFEDGPFPEGFISNLSNLKELSLSNTALTGTMPSSINSLSHLRLLDLDNNSMRGSIPSEINMLKKLEVLLLSRNNFKGELPVSIVELESLETLLINDNRITGSAEKLLCEKEDPKLRAGNLTHFVADCPGEYECPCCTACCGMKDVYCDMRTIIAKSMNGNWENHYSRTDWNFHWETIFNSSEPLSDDDYW